MHGLSAGLHLQGVATLYGPIIAFDRATFLALNNSFRCALLDVLLPKITDLGLGHIQFIACLLSAVAIELFSHRLDLHRWPRALFTALHMQRLWLYPALAALVSAGLASDIVKTVSPGDRPWWFYTQQHSKGHMTNVNADIVAGVYPLKVHRFPSGHTTTSVTVAVVISMVPLRRSKRTALVRFSLWTLVLVVAYSRIYLGSHWPLDLLGGAVLGTLFGAGCVWIFSSLHSPPVQPDRSTRSLSNPAGGLAAGGKPEA